MFRTRFCLSALALLVLALPALAHDVKDPVCRMTVDSDTTPYQRTVDGKTLYFCSTHCESQFDKSPKTYLDLLARLSADGGAGYSATLHAVDARPGAPVSMDIVIRNRKTNAVVTKYEVTHTKLLHLLLVSRDMQWFEHQHPTLGSDGTFHITWTFPRAGRYYLYADFTPVDGDNQIKRMVLDVGTSPNSTSAPNLKPALPKSIEVGDVRVGITVADRQFVAGRQNLITYRFSDEQGKPCTDMQPFIGAMGHMIALREDGTNPVHVHVLHGVAPGSYAAAMLAVMQTSDNLKVTPEMVTEHGPAFSFKLTLPTPGVYRVWAQFMRHNRVITVPITVLAGKA